MINRRIGQWYWTALEDVFGILRKTPGLLNSEPGNTLKREDALGTDMRTCRGYRKWRTWRETGAQVEGEMKAGDETREGKGVGNIRK